VVTGRFETWLAGGRAATGAQRNTAATPAKPQVTAGYPGERYELPADGPGSVAALWRRFVALVVDCVLATLITSLFVRPGSLQPEHVQTLNYWSLLTWFLITVIGTAFFGATPGMMAVGIRVARTDGGSMLLPLRAIVRAVLTAVIVPAVVWDADRRSLHDKAAGTIVLTSR
jgi:uncharacterized RDD family membrane protein YckC